MMSLKIGARAVGVVLVAIFGLWCAQMLIRGTHTYEATEERVVIENGVERVEPSQARPVRQSQTGAVVLLVGLLLIGIGLSRDAAMPAAWLGWGLMVLLGVPLIFNVGLLMLSMAGLLALPLSILQWQISDRRGWLIAGWVGAALLLGEGWLLRLTPSGAGLMMVAIGVMMVVILAWIQFHPEQQAAQ
jgi:hypothetical protein